MLSSPKATIHKGAVHCPMCTHSVDADVVVLGRKLFVKPGQKCPRCGGQLDVAVVLRFEKAA